MTSTGPTSTTASFADRDHRAEIVERLYDVAVDPIRLEELLEVWEGRVAPLRDSAIALEDAEIEAHLARATVFLDRYDAAAVRDGQPSVLEEIPRSAAFLADGGAQVAGCNRAAGLAFGIAEGGPFAALPFEPEDRELLQGVIRKVALRKAEKVVTLRIRSTVTGSPVILRVSPVEGPKPLALVVSTELVWPEGFATTVQEAFGLTAAEVEIVRGVTLGLPLRDIAEARGRSLETVRTQVRSVLAKTETHSQAELVRVVLGLMDVALVPVAGQAGPAARGELEPRPWREMRAVDGRRLTWISFGDPAGQPVLYMHLDYGLIRWPAAAERAAAARGLRVIVPVRAGYGRTDPLPKGADHLEGVTQDYAAVLDHLGLKGAVAIPLGADLRFAMHLANTRPDLVRGIVGAACQLPIRTPAQYERMDKWQRFILANARHAPRVLPFLVQAGFSLARRLGKEPFFRQVNGGSAADMATFALAEVKAAVLEGSDVCMSAKWSAHAAFTAECIGSEKDWSAVVRAVRVPVRLLQGDQDPQSPVQTIRELAAEYPHLAVEFLPETGQLLFFAAWPQVLDAVQRMLAAGAAVGTGH
ncbi:LuxR C-terminal-related transcriptional regulator [Tabrizicola aquatica]|uniref:LuxR C-terminal-related transcriptional regulator n=1 Tax=Tabrizicola aquatica TaxID=909926 RepID=UPI000CD1869B|nr:LuxR C-terminal-related transcriptional regulator [Tabrizicola aquatica]